MSDIDTDNINRMGFKINKSNFLMIKYLKKKNLDAFKDVQNYTHHLRLS